jgi:AraC-like DNA-binding protein/mannose-6-phosphate isomerase-like protein (cupin superfamily)
MIRPDQRIARSHGTKGAWDYWRPAAEGILELGTVRGETVGLPTHFHWDDQLTFVLSGRRRFVIGGEVVVLETGQGTLIAAGVPHRSLSEPDGVVCFNAYVPPAEYAVADMISAIRRLRLEADRIACPVSWGAITAAIRAHQGCLRKIAADAVAASTAPGVTVGVVATRMGVSREGFSRTFVKRHGMPPHAYGFMHRLNRARDRLRAGQDIADVAFETGFADQSHLGRWFKRAFGVSPGLYRRG